MFEHKSQHGFLVYDPEHREYFQSKDDDKDSPAVDQGFERSPHLPDREGSPLVPRNGSDDQSGRRDDLQGPALLLCYGD